MCNGQGAAAEGRAYQAYAAGPRANERPQTPGEKQRERVANQPTDALMTMSQRDLNTALRQVMREMRETTNPKDKAAAEKIANRIDAAIKAKLG